MSRAPRVLGFCREDIPSAASYANSAQRRLVMCREAGDEGWWGTWAEVAFRLVSQTNPYITLPRGIARIEKLNVCNRPVPIQNQFYEYLDFGNGRMPKLCGRDGLQLAGPQALTRNNVVTFADQTVSPCIIRIYTTNAQDVTDAKSVLIQGLDQNGSVVRTEYNQNQVQGEYVDCASPFADSTFQFSILTGLQKDQTLGEVQIFQVDPATGDETLLLTMEPNETVAGYRRYYLNNLPPNCCCLGVGGVQDLVVTAIVKLDMIPVQTDTDYLLLHNLEALIEESIATRMSEMDNTEAQQMAMIHHVNAVRYLNGEIAHYLGKQSPAVNFAPFGTARLDRQKIGTLI